MKYEHQFDHADLWIEVEQLSNDHLRRLIQHILCHCQNMEVQLNQYLTELATRLDTIEFRLNNPTTGPTFAKKVYTIMNDEDEKLGT